MPKRGPVGWALVAHGVGSVCPRLVLSMPKACSADAHPLVRKGHVVGTEVPWVAGFFITRMILL